MAGIDSINSASVNPGIASAAGASSSAAKDGSQNKTSARAAQLTPAQQAEVAALKQTQASVIAHEQAHIEVGRDLITSGPNYSYTYGPDGKRYISGGDVGIDTSPAQKPQENIAKGEHIVATALAPRDPSAADYRVAALGDELTAEGRAALAQEQAAAARQQLAQTYASSDAMARSGTLDVSA